MQVLTNTFSKIYNQFYNDLHVEITCRLYVARQKTSYIFRGSIRSKLFSYEDVKHFVLHLKTIKFFLWWFMRDMRQEICRKIHYPRYGVMLFLPAMIATLITHMNPKRYNFIVYIAFFGNKLFNCA